MAELGEGVKVGTFIDPKDKCPFSHEAPPDEEIKNVLIGKGGWLKSRMTGGKQTFLYDKSPYRGNDDKKMKRPKETDWHPFARKSPLPIQLTFPTEDGGQRTVGYKATCAAHHLIPAQQSLKESDLLVYMVGKDESGASAELNDGSKVTGKCWTNVGYDVNGSQNGVYLPGSYAVRSKTQRWVPLNMSKEDKEEYEDTEQGVDADNDLLWGEQVEINEENRKWLYVKQVVEKAGRVSKRGYGGQFHDSHSAYGRIVLAALQKIHTRYEKWENNADKDCEDCKKRDEEIGKKDGVPTPFVLVLRLNIVSRRLENCLNGRKWVPGYYTSDWGKAYIQQLQRNKRMRRLGG